jgi:hypothetical protein
LATLSCQETVPFPRSFFLLGYPLVVKKLYRFHVAVVVKSMIVRLGYPLVVKKLYRFHVAVVVKSIFVLLGYPFISALTILMPDPFGCRYYGRTEGHLLFPSAFFSEISGSFECYSHWHKPTAAFLTGFMTWLFCIDSWDVLPKRHFAFRYFVLISSLSSLMCSFRRSLESGVIPTLPCWNEVFGCR